jgi:hypothetical protein
LKHVFVFRVPIDGPTALEAIARGCVYINPLNRIPASVPNKMNGRLYRSQHSFVEEYIKEPFAYTIDITNITAVTMTVKKILASEPTPFVHPFQTPTAYVENLRNIFEYHSSHCDTGRIPIGHPSNKQYASYDGYLQALEDAEATTNRAMAAALFDNADDDVKKNEIELKKQAKS